MFLIIWLLHVQERSLPGLYVTWEVRGEAWLNKLLHCRTSQCLWDTVMQCESTRRHVMVLPTLAIPQKPSSAPLLGRAFNGANVPQNTEWKAQPQWKRDLVRTSQVPFRGQFSKHTIKALLCSPLTCSGTESTWNQKHVNGSSMLWSRTSHGFCTQWVPNTPSKVGSFYPLTADSLLPP